MLERFEHLLDSMYEAPQVDNDSESIPSETAIEIAREVLRSLYNDFKLLPDKIGAFVDGLIGLQYGDDGNFFRFEVYNDGEIVLLQRSGEQLEIRDLTREELTSLYPVLIDPLERS